MARFPDPLFINMHRIFYIFIALFLAFPAMADDAVDKTAVAATASYVDSAYNHMNAQKQDKLTSTNVVESGTGPVVQSVTASNGNVIVSKGEITIPSGTQSGPTSGGARAEIWFE